MNDWLDGKQRKKERKKGSTLNRQKAEVADPKLSIKSLKSQKQTFVKKETSKKTYFPSSSSRS